jgi:hypothetical protein
MMWGAIRSSFTPPKYEYPKKCFTKTKACQVKEYNKQKKSENEEQKKKIESKNEKKIRKENGNRKKRYL